MSDIIRFNKIVVLLMLLGVFKLTNEERAQIWNHIVVWNYKDEIILTSILENRS